MHHRICQFVLLLVLLLYGSGVVEFAHLAIEHAPGGAHYHGKLTAGHHCGHGHSCRQGADPSSDEKPRDGDLQYCDFLLSLHLMGGEVAIAAPMLAEQAPVGYVRERPATPVVACTLRLPMPRGPPIA